MIRNTNPFEYYIIQQLFNDVNVPRCLTENLSYQNIFIPFKYTLLLFSRFYFLGQKYKGHDFLRAGAFSSVAPPSATRLTEDMFLPEQSWKKEEQTSEQSFDNTIINIRMTEMNSMIYSKTSVECLRERMGNSPKMTEGTKKVVRHS